MKSTLSIAVLAVSLASCGNSNQGETHAGNHASGRVAIDGSSTVFPITEAVAEEYRTVAPDVRVTVGVSGTGGGFKKFIAGETDISNASRYIKSSELKACADNGRDFIELPVAFDGLAVVVNKKNDFVKTMTVDELHKIWAADSVVTKWSDVRAEWPDREFKLFAPGQDSGTFDYFTETINGESGNCRGDVTFSEDDNVLVRGVAGEVDSLGFFGLAYYMENKDTLNCVGIDPGSGNPVLPSFETVEGGTYTPLSRPLFIYVSKKAAEENPALDAFVEFYLTSARELATEVGYVPFPEALYTSLKARFSNRVLGSETGKTGTVEQLYAAQ